MGGQMVIDLARAKARREIRSHLLAAGAEALARGDKDLHEQIAFALNSLSEEDVTANPQGDELKRV